MQSTYVSSLPGTTSMVTPIAKSMPVTQVSVIIDARITNCPF